MRSSQHLLFIAAVNRDHQRQMPQTYSRAQNLLDGMPLRKRCEEDDNIVIDGRGPRLICHITRSKFLVFTCQADLTYLYGQYADVDGKPTCQPPIFFPYFLLLPPHLSLDVVPCQKKKSLSPDGRYSGGFHGCRLPSRPASPVLPLRRGSTGCQLAGSTMLSAQARSRGGAPESRPWEPRGG